MTLKYLLFIKTVKKNQYFNKIKIIIKILVRRLISVCDFVFLLKLLAC